MRRLAALGFAFPAATRRRLPLATSSGFTGHGPLATDHCFEFAFPTTTRHAGDLGGPEIISFEFQTMLDMNYAVGRIAFDRPEQYRRYVEGLIAYEKAGAAPNGREVLYWGPRNRADRATQLSADCLIRPLFDGIPATGDQTGLPAIAKQRRFRSRCLGGPDATRANLLEPLHAVEVGRRPAFLFTASHGLVWPNGHESQMSEEGALLCQDWPGLGVPPRSEHCLRAADLGDDAQLHGLVAFLFACHGAGTPAFDQFLADRAKGPVPIAGRPFVAALPQQLLSHANGPASLSSDTSSGPGATRSGRGAWARGCGRSAT